MANFDVIIKNGTVLDGESAEGRLADVGIEGEKIVAVTNLGGSKAGLIIDATNKYVAPGFIDIQNHSDSYFTLLENPSAESMTAQGITTMCVGQCGSSLAPLAHPDALKSIQKWHSLAGTNINWLSFSEYVQAMQNYPLGPNVISMIGHSTVRRGLIKDEVRPANEEELAVMKNMIMEGLGSGAAGISLGLVYAHESNASAGELKLAAELVSKTDKLYSVHLRSEGENLAQAVAEVVGLAQETGARLKISHFKSRGEKNWPVIDEALGVIENAYEKGVDVFFDVYPYTTSWTVLYTYLPKWSYEGGRAQILKHLSNPIDKKKILDHLRSLGQDLGNIFIATSETAPNLVGKNLHQIAANQEVSVEEALLNVVQATQTQVVVFDRNLSADVMKKLIRHPLSVISTDGAGYNFQFHPMHGLVHPRCFGTMPKFLSMVRKEQVVTWSEAIRKITALPAEKLKLTDRGKLKNGMFADVVVFDPKTIDSDASYENPYQKPKGIEQVFINGRLSSSVDHAPEDLVGKWIKID